VKGISKRTIESVRFSSLSLKDCLTSNLSLPSPVFQKRAQKLHPDKHPDKESEFLALSEAYQTLSDPELRKIYDRYGEDGVKKHQAQGGRGGGGGGDPFDVFRHFFGGGGRGDDVRKGQTKNFNVEVGLEDMYVSREKEVGWWRAGRFVERTRRRRGVGHRSRELVISFGYSRAGRSEQS